MTHFDHVISPPPAPLRPLYIPYPPESFSLLSLSFSQKTKSNPKKQ